MQSVSSRIWTRVTVSISYNDNNYTTGTSSFYQPDRIWHKVNFLVEFYRFEFRVFLLLNKISLSYHLPITAGRIIELIPFPMVLVLCEMELASSRIWTRVTVSTSYDDSHYTTGITPRFNVKKRQLIFTCYTWK